MLNEDELVKNFKKTSYYVDAMNRLTPDEAAEVDARVEATYRQMIRSLSPFMLRLATEPEFLEGIQREIDRRVGVVNTQENTSETEPVVLSEKDGKKNNA